MSVSPRSSCAVRRWASVAALVAVCAAPATARGGATSAAPPADRADLTELSLEQLMDVEVTSVLRKPERRSESAAAVYVLTADDMRRAGVLTIPDALRLVPGVQVARIDANKWAIGIRGFASRVSRSVLVLIDGRTVYSPLFAGTYWEVQDTLLEDVERIEVVRGPGGAVWGANAVNGVINIITKSAEHTQGLYVTGGGGNEERGFGAVRWGGKLGKSFYWRVYGKYFDRDAGFNPSGPPSYDGWHMSREGLRIDWDVTPRDRLTVLGDVYDGDAGTMTTVTHFDPPATRRVFADETLSGGSVLARLQHVFSATSEGSLQFYYDNTFRSEPNFRERRNTYDLELQHRFALPWRQVMMWGLEYRASEGKSPPRVESVEFVPHAKRDDLVTAFIQDDVALVPDVLRLTLGVKFEHNDYSGFEWQPSGRLAWTPHPRHTVWGAVSRAVRTPTRIDTELRVDAVLPSGDVSRILGSHEFDSEQVTAYELGWRVKATDLLFLDVAAFYNRYDDLFSAEPGAPTTDPRLPGRRILPIVEDNRLHGEGYGLEIAGDAELAEPWHVHAAYTAMRLRLHRDPGSRDVGVEAAEDQTPRHQIALRSELRLPARFELDGVMRFVDDIAGPVGGYLTFDARLAWTWRSHVEISIVGRDLADAHHREFPGGTEVERSVFGQVRTWW
jgi:iron complex outermembrane receptor protein